MRGESGRVEAHRIEAFAFPARFPDEALPSAGGDLTAVAHAMLICHVHDTAQFLRLPVPGIASTPIIVLPVMLLDPSRNHLLRAESPRQN